MSLGKRDMEWLKFRRKFLQGKKNFEGYYICAHCFGWFKDITVDHIQRRGSHPELTYEPSNLQLLCASCHIDKDGGFNAEEKRKYDIRTFGK